MNPQLESILNDTEGRYLEATEQSELIDFANSLEDRLRAMRSVQQHESQVIKAAMESLWDEYPEMKTEHVDAYERGVRDMTLVLRYTALAMVRDSEAFLEQKLLHWFKTILEAFDMSEPVAFAYRCLRDELQQAMPAEDFALLDPFIERTCEILSPTPSTAAAE